MNLKIVNVEIDNNNDCWMWYKIQSLLQGVNVASCIEGESLPIGDLAFWNLRRSSMLNMVLASFVDVYFLRGGVVQLPFERLKKRGDLFTYILDEVKAEY